MGMHAFAVLYQGLRMADPSYFDDFWTVSGYLGAAAPTSLLRDRVQQQCAIVAMLTADQLTVDELSRLGLHLGPQPGQSHGA